MGQRIKYCILEMLRWHSVTYNITFWKESILYICHKYSLLNYHKIDDLLFIYLASALCMWVMFVVFFFILFKKHYYLFGCTHLILIISKRNFRAETYKSMCLYEGLYCQINRKTNSLVNFSTIHVPSTL